MIVILTTLGVSFMLLENIYSTDFIHDDHHLQIYKFIVQAASGKNWHNLSEMDCRFFVTLVRSRGTYLKVLMIS
jgi:hypothetical protein